MDVRRTPLHLRYEAPLGMKGLFVVALFAMLLTPLVAMPFAPDPETSERRTLSPEPQLVGEEGSLNVEVLSDAGAYFTDHFAFRPYLIDLNATLRQRYLLTSATPNVVVGTDGWLYYAGELGDYQGTGLMTDAAIENAAMNLYQMHEYVTSQGKSFVVVIAPNKSSIATSHMPYYILPTDADSNLYRLCSRLRRLGVPYVEARRVLSEDLFFKRDSHWNDEGAYAVAGLVSAALGGPRADLSKSSVTIDEHLGDLDGMLHPVTAEPEQQVLRLGAEHFQIANDAADIEDSYVVTNSTADVGATSILLYRDSFANNLAAPLATVYKQAVFTKLVPYDMSAAQVGFADDVVVERAERHLSSFATMPPYMPAVERTIQQEGEVSHYGASIYALRQDPYLVIEGSLEDEVLAGHEVYCQLSYADGRVRTFACLRVSEAKEGMEDYEGQRAQENGHIIGDAGYRAYVKMGESDEPVHVRIMVGTRELAREVASAKLEGWK